jgi:hypothetical protein
MTDNTPEAPARLLERVHKLLAKAEDESCTPQESQALTEKAAALMAKYGIDRALLAAAKPETDKQTAKMLDIDNPWARVKAHLYCGIASAMRCQVIMLARSGTGTRLHVFGYTSDIERVDMLNASVLIQMWHGLAGARVPDYCGNVRAWRRSWLLGFATAVIGKVRAAEAAAVKTADTEPSGHSAVVAIADRNLIIEAAVKEVYPRTRTARVTYSGSGYAAGHEKGRQADIGGSRLGRPTRGALR